MLENSWPVERKERAKRRLLIVDDQTTNVEILQYYLEKAGYETVVAMDGVMAIRALCGAARRKRGGTPSSALAFDLVLMDLQMPRLDGLETVRLLREHGWTTPIIAVTAQTLADDRQRCLDAGCDDYLRKPIEPKELLEVCERVLARRAARAA